MKKIILIFILLSNNYLFSYDLVGTGASFPYQFLKIAFEDYSNKHNLTINYNPTGSKNGFESLKKQEVDFSAVDMFLNDKLINSFPYPKDIIHVPICISGIGIGYNVKNIKNLNLTAKVLSEILIKKITNWNDKKIQKLNPKIKLPNLEIVVILRKGGSGSTYLLTQYLSKLNSLWKLSFGKSLEINFPGCILANNSSHMQKLLSQIPGSIGYVGYSYKKNNNFQFAAIENLRGNFIKPTIDSISNAANITLPKDSRASMINSNSNNGYPISSFSWIITYKNQNYNKRNKQKLIDLQNLLKWLTTDAQKLTTKAGYSPLPNNVREIATNILDTMTYKKIKNQ